MVSNLYEIYVGGDRKNWRNRIQVKAGSRQEAKKKAWAWLGDISRMRDLRAMEFGPLRNWRRCLCGNVVRLMHDTVLEQVQDAMERQELARLSKDERAAAQRLQRLRKALADEKLSKEVIADDTLIARMDEWLTTTRQGRRTPAVYRSAILHAVQMGWLNRRTMR